jgi:hypothetical protein
MSRTEQMGQMSKKSEGRGQEETRCFSKASLEKRQCKKYQGAYKRDTMAAQGFSRMLLWAAALTAVCLAAYRTFFNTRRLPGTLQERRILMPCLEI